VAVQLGFENAYALAMKQDEATRLRVRTLSDLTAKAPTLRIGSDYEFFQRSEWKLLAQTYSLAFAEQRSMDPSLMYEALRTGQVDVISAFSSDGRIASYGLTALADDRHAVLPYDAVILTRPGLAVQHPQAMTALQALGGTISAERMRRLNAAVDKAGESPAAVAERFLTEQAARP
jgi:osmoprotectant transport system permease protein